MRKINKEEKQVQVAISQEIWLLLRREALTALDNLPEKQQTPAYMLRELARIWAMFLQTGPWEFTWETLTGDPQTSTWKDIFEGVKNARLHSKSNTAWTIKQCKQE